jgi:hypothetical protein
MLFRFMQKWGLSSSRAYCIFLKSTNRNVQNVLAIVKVMDGQLDKTVAIYVAIYGKNTIRT